MSTENLTLKRSKPDKSACMLKIDYVYKGNKRIKSLNLHLLKNYKLIWKRNRVKEVEK